LAHLNFENLVAIMYGFFGEDLVPVDFTSHFGCQEIHSMPLQCKFCRLKRIVGALITDLCFLTVNEQTRIKFDFIEFMLIA